MTIEQIIETAEKDLKERFAEIEDTEAFWTRRILKSFQEKEVSYRHFAGTTGYGNGDIGRDTLEAVCFSFWSRGSDRETKHSKRNSCIGTDAVRIGSARGRNPVCDRAAL